MSNLQTHHHFKLDFQKVEQPLSEASGKNILYIYFVA